MDTAYVIYDTETKTLWKNGRGKKTWSAAGHAKNAWNVGRYREPKFSEQTRFECWKAELTLVEKI